MKKTHIICIFSVLIILLCNCAFGLKIQLGADNKIFFEPNLQKEMILDISEAERPARVPISIGGDMAQYATIDPSSLEMSPGEKKQVKLTIKLPESIPKGVHSIEISAKEVPTAQQDGAFVWIPGVGFNLKIINTDVLEDCTLQVLNTAMSPNTIGTTMNVANAGLNQIGGVYATLTLYDSEGMPVTDWTTGTITIPPFDSATLQESHTWQESVNPGYYTVKGTLNCGEKKIPIEVGALNGANTVKVNEFRVFKRDGKLFVEFDLENENEAPVTTAAYTQILDGEKVLDHYDMTGASLSPLGKNMLSFGAPITGLYVNAGTYDVKTTLSIQGGAKQDYIKQITITEDDVSKKSTGGGFGASGPIVPQEAQPEQEIAFEQPDSEGTSNKTLVRIIAGLLILVILTLIILKVLSKKNQ